MTEKHPLEKIDFNVIGVERYRGCLVTKVIGGFSVFGKSSTTPEGIDEIIDQSCSILSETITNTGTISCQNTENENKL